MALQEHAALRLETPSDRQGRSAEPPIDASGRTCGKAALQIAQAAPNPHPAALQSPLFGRKARPAARQTGASSRTCRPAALRIAHPSQLGRKAGLSGETPVCLRPPSWLQTGPPARIGRFRRAKHSVRRVNAGLLGAPSAAWQGWARLYRLEAPGGVRDRTGLVGCGRFSPSRLTGFWRLQRLYCGGLTSAAGPGKLPRLRVPIKTVATNRACAMEGRASVGTRPSTDAADPVQRWFEVAL